MVIGGYYNSYTGTVEGGSSLLGVVIGSCVGGCCLLIIICIIVVKCRQHRMKTQVEEWKVKEKIQNEVIMVNTTPLGAVAPPQPMMPTMAETPVMIEMQPMQQMQDNMPM